MVLLHDPIERICGGCVRAQDIRRMMDEAVLEENEGAEDALGLGLRGLRMRTENEMRSRAASSEVADEGSTSSGEDPIRTGSQPIAIAQSSIVSSMAPAPTQAQSLPPELSRPWSLPSTSHTPAPRREESVEPEVEVEEDVVPNPLMDINRTRIDSSGKAALHPGSVFKGTQTSGRSAYEVEVRIVVSRLLLCVI